MPNVNVPDYGTFTDTLSYEYLHKCLKTICIAALQYGLKERILLRNNPKADTSELKYNCKIQIEEFNRVYKIYCEVVKKDQTLDDSQKAQLTQCYSFENLSLSILETPKADFDAIAPLTLKHN